MLYQKAVENVQKALYWLAGGFNLVRTRFHDDELCYRATEKSYLSAGFAEERLSSDDIAPVKLAIYRMLHTSQLPIVTR